MDILSTCEVYLRFSSSREWHRLQMHFSYCCSRDKCTNYKEKERGREGENKHERDSLSRQGGE